VLGGALKNGAGADVTDTVAAYLAGVSQEAARTAKLLGLGVWMGLSAEGSTATSTSRIRRRRRCCSSCASAACRSPVGDSGAARDGDGAPLAGETVSKALDLITRVRGVRGAMLVSAEDGLVVAEQLMEGIKGGAVAALRRASPPVAPGDGSGRHGNERLLASSSGAGAILVVPGDATGRHSRRGGRGTGREYRPRPARAAARRGGRDMSPHTRASRAGRSSP